MNVPKSVTIRPATIADVEQLVELREKLEISLQALEEGFIYIYVTYVLCSYVWGAPQLFAPVSRSHSQSQQTLKGKRAHQDTLALKKALRGDKLLKQVEHSVGWEHPILRHNRKKKA